MNLPQFAPDLLGLGQWFLPEATLSKPFPDGFLAWMRRGGVGVCMLLRFHRLFSLGVLAVQVPLFQDGTPAPAANSAMSR